VGYRNDENSLFLEPKDDREGIPSQQDAMRTMVVPK
jgi:hypothetical protein